MTTHLDKQTTTLCLIRHAESVWNAEGRVQGQMESPLSPLGLAQADLLGRRLEHEPWSVLYSSDLGRSRQTAASIAKYTKLTPRFDLRLRERALGKREGRLKTELEQLSKDQSAAEMEIESEEILLSRARKAIDEIRDNHPGERILVVSHAALMRIYLRNTFPSLDSSQIINTSCTVMNWDGNSWTLESFSDATHLGELANPKELSVDDMGFVRQKHDND